MLDKKGNSDSDERMNLLDRFQEIFPDAQIASLTGDHEFVGKEWLTYLLIEPQISFRLRIHESEGICHSQKQLRASLVFAHLQHFIDCQRLSKLVALMALALCWAVKTGEWLYQHQPIKLLVTKFFYFFQGNFVPISVNAEKTK